MIDLFPFFLFFGSLYVYLSLGCFVGNLLSIAKGPGGKGACTLEQQSSILLCGSFAGVLQQ